VTVSPETLVELRGVTKNYKRGGETVHVLENLDLDIKRGDFIALMGPSGSGKTTLLNLIGGLDRPSSGTVSVEGRAINQLSESALARWRADNVGFIFQMYNLLPVLTAERNVELPLLLTKLRKSDRARRWSWWGLRIAQSTDLVSCRAGRNSASALHAPSSQIRPCFCATSPRVTSTASPVMRFWIYFRG
jgi:predicted ABC-type transport system involved in lysophospholipase L1 biosynthesis ATPase subunit